MHWAVAIPFMVCYTTALILVVVYNPDPARPFRHVVSWTHRISGLCLFVLPAFNFARHWRDASLHLRNVGQVWKWSWDDVKWLFLIGPASMNPKITLPWQGKFNAGEKINFMVLSSTYPIYVCTGLLIWFGASPYLSWLVHFSLAVVATPLLLGHVFMATVNPDTRPGLRGMITGFVDREWARHHYRLWYVEHFEASRGLVARALSVTRPGLAAPPPRPRPALSPGAPRRHDRPIPLVPPAAWPTSAARGRGAFSPLAASSRAR
jgi:formate dehydrogenase gamma subunit